VGHNPGRESGENRKKKIFSFKGSVQCETRWFIDIFLPFEHAVFDIKKSYFRFRSVLAKNEAIFYNRATQTKQAISLITLRECVLRPEPEKNLQSMNFELITHRVRSASPNDARFRRSGFSNISGFPVVLAFRLFKLSCRSSCPVILAIPVTPITENKRNLKK